MKSRLPLFILLGGVAPLFGGAAESSTPAAHATGWETVPSILARIKAPQFPARDFSITDFGAVAGGQDCTSAIARAIAACHAAGAVVCWSPEEFFTPGPCI